MSATRTGDWAQFRKFAEQMAGRHIVQAALDKAMREEAERFRAAVIRGIASGAPGGKAFAPHAPLTTALRAASGFGGSKVLIQTAALMQSTSVKRVKSAHYLVGVNRKSATGVNIAAVHEFGATIQVTSKMARYLAVRAREAGLPPGGGGGGKGFIRIPPRPFLRPIVGQELSDTGALMARFQANVAKHLGWSTGGGGGAGSGTESTKGATRTRTPRTSTPRAPGGGGGPGRASNGRFTKKT